MDSVYYIKKVETQKQTNGWVSKLVIEDKVGKQLVFIGKICKGSAEAKQSCAQLYSDFRNMMYSLYSGDDVWEPRQLGSLSSTSR